MDRRLRKLKTAQKKFESVRQPIEAELQELADFELRIDWQLGDGFTLLAIEEEVLVPLSDALEIVKREGRLSVESLWEHRF